MSVDKTTVYSWLSSISAALVGVPVILNMAEEAFGIELTNSDRRFMLYSVVVGGVCYVVFNVLFGKNSKDKEVGDEQ